MVEDAYERIEALRRKRSRRVVGLISGTSADGVSAAVTEIEGTGTDIRLSILGHRNYPYPPPLREEVFRLFDPGTSTVDGVCRMNFVLGWFFAECALRLAEEAGLEAGDIDLIGSHGQTVYHSPCSPEMFGYPSRSTLQIGEPAVIAEETRVPTVADFRKADVAAGGEGAPLTPYLDYVLHRHGEESRVLQNIGGIANLTYIPAGASPGDVIAFDTGPGNMLIDAVVRHYTRGERSLDEGGRIAERGTINEGLLGELLSHPYFRRGPPKTTGREAFGGAFAAEAIRRAGEMGLGFEDLVATATALTVESMASAYEDLLGGGRIDGVYVSGGGANNSYLMRALGSRVSPIPVRKSDDLGVPSDAKEAVLMAVLANEHVMGTPSNMPGATGAERRVVLGHLYAA